MDAKRKDHLWEIKKRQNKNTKKSDLKILRGGHANE